MISPPEIIGRGTWYDKAAMELLDREKRLGRSLELVRTESGLGASGFPHIGSLGDCIRNYAIALAVEEHGYRAEYIAFSDDKDGLRKVPAGMPKELERWLGYPVSDIPDPFGRCHENFGDHMSSLLLEALDVIGVEYRFISGTRVYRDGLMNSEIIEIMEGAKRAGEIIYEEIGQTKFLTSLPYFPVCESCGRIYTTNAYKYLPDERKVLYRCEGMEVKGRWLEGCGHEGEVDVTSGEGKLSWKVEFAARWRALDIRFEAYGKDIADSVRVNDLICREILNHEPPMHVQYEMFLDKGGRKISKSAGNVFTPQVWFRYGSPQSLNLLLLKRFIGTRSIGVEDIPLYMDELDRLENVYFGKIVVEDMKERAKLRGLYEYCWLLRPPVEPSVHVPYRLLVNLARVAPEGKEAEYIREKLQEYGYLRGGERRLEDRIRFALNWVKDFQEPIRKAVELSEEEAAAVRMLIEELKRGESAEDFQSAVFRVARSAGLSPRRFFRTLYLILLGEPQGPRFGPYVEAIGRESAIEELERVLGES